MSSDKKKILYHKFYLKKKKNKNAIQNINNNNIRDLIKLNYNFSFYLLYVSLCFHCFLLYISYKIK